MRILSYQNIQVPSTSAHSLYMVRSCAELSREIPLDLIVARGDAHYAFDQIYRLAPADYPQWHLHRPPVRHKSISGVWNRWTARRLLRRRPSGDTIVYISQAKPLRFFSRLKGRGGPPFTLVVECHALDELRKADLSRVDAMVYMSESLRRECREQFPCLTDKPDLVSFHWTDARPAPVPAVAPGDRFVVCYVGSVLAWKGIETLARAAAHLPESFGILIVGGREDEPYRQSLVREVAESGLSDRVEFVPFVPPAQLAEAVRRADAFVLPLPSEFQGSMPMKLVEYFAWGRPVIATDLPSIREVITHRHNGLLCAPASPEALADQIRALAAMPLDARRALAARALDTLASFSVDRWRSHLATWFRSLPPER